MSRGGWRPGAGLGATLVALTSVVGLLMGSPVPAGADFHLVEIREVMTGLNGNSNIQYIKMRMGSDFQHCQGTGLSTSQTTCVAQGEGAELVFFDGAVTQTGRFNFPTNTPLGAFGRSFLIATPAFASMSGAPTPDHIMPAGLLVPGSGVVCYRSLPNAPFGVDTCLAYGNVNGCFQHDTPFVHTHCFPPAAAALPATGAVALKRVSSTFDSSLAFKLGVPEPCNNAGACKTLGVSRYDAFSEPSVSFLKWAGIEDATTPDVVNSHSQRRIVSGQLLIALTTHGATTSNSGLSGEGRHQLRIGHEALADNVPRIVTLQAKATVKSATAVHCADNFDFASATRTRAQVFGFFFNDGTGNAIAGDLQGDVVAGIELERKAQPFGDPIDRILAFLRRCDTPACEVPVILKTAEVTAGFFPRRWSVGVAEVLTVQWMPASNHFVFSARSGQLAGESVALTYHDIPLSDAAPPKARIIKGLGVANAVPNCAAGPREASMEVRFDNVQLNSAAVKATK